MITAHLAVLKAGKFSLGLDPAASDTRLDHLLNDSQATLIVTDAEAAPVAHHCMKPEQQLIHMDDINSNTSEENLDLAISPCAYSYLRYTSGSTGQAKGGLKTHRHVMHAVMNATNYFHICANDRLVLLTRDTCFGKYAFEVLLNGASLCPFYIQEEGLLHLIDWLIQEEITIYHSFSTVFRSPYIAPRTAIERELWRIWTEVLDLEQIGVYDNFFDLGGHSLAATRVVSQVIKTFQLDLPVKALFDSPTVAQMAAVIVEHRAKQLTGPEFERMLTELESISEEKARQLLVNAKGTNTERQPDE